MKNFFRIQFVVLGLIISDVGISSTFMMPDKIALRRGASLYMNYCSGCHSLRYLRYNRLVEDLGLDGAGERRALLNNLVSTHVQSYDPIIISMPAEDAREWFGVVPPDLSLIARQKGPAWLLKYLTGFYVDSSRPFGSNNSVVSDSAMPNILGPLKGKMSEKEFNQVLQDLIVFLVYVAEPERASRYPIGIFVILFLLLFLLVIYRLKNLKVNKP